MGRQEAGRCCGPEIKKNLYVDDLISGSTTIEKARVLGDGAIEIFEDAKFALHK